MSPLRWNERKIRLWIVSEFFSVSFCFFPIAKLGLFCYMLNEKTCLDLNFVVFVESDWCEFRYRLPGDWRNFRCPYSVV